MLEINKITTSFEDTINYAKSISSLFELGSIYGLRGELGSGKTTFIKGLLQGLAIRKWLTHLHLH